MLHIIKQYKQLFILTITNKLSSWLSTPFNDFVSKDTNHDWKINNVEIWDSKKVKELLEAWFSSSDIISWVDLSQLKEKYNIEKKETIIESQNNQEILKKDIEIFTWTLKKWSKWNEVTKLQKFLVSTWNLIMPKWVDYWYYGNLTVTALKSYLSNEFPNKNYSWNVAWNITRKAMEKTLLNTINIKSNIQINDANILIDSLNTVEQYLTAFNKIYWWTEDIISRHNGLLWIINHLWENDIDKLVDELKPNFDKIDQDKLSKELWLNKNSDKFKSWLKRTAIIAVLSFITSWWASIALELFAINYGENLKEWPEVNKILKTLWSTNNDIKKQTKNVLLSKETTVWNLNEILDILNNPDMDTANFKRLINEIYNPNWFQKTFWLFLPDYYEAIDIKIKQFENTNNTKDAKNIVKEIYEYSYKAYLESKENMLTKKQILDNNINEIDNDLPDVFMDDNSEDIEFIKMEYINAVKDFKVAEKSWWNLSKITWRYTNLDAKRSNIEWDTFDIEWAKNRELEIDKILWISALNTVNEKLHSDQSFWFEIDKWMIWNKNYMQGMVSKMKSETINWKSSILSGLIRWIEQHYFAWAKTFTPENFIDAFSKTAKSATSEYILSNLWRERNQKFQWEIWKWELFQITLNNTEIYFKDKCTNIVTIVNGFVTTVDSTSSIPIVMPIKTWINNWWNSWNTWSNEDGSTTPIEIENWRVEELGNTINSWVSTEQVIISWVSH